MPPEAGEASKTLPEILHLECCPTNTLVLAQWN
jgi:hypothetical protein